MIQETRLSANHVYELFNKYCGDIVFLAKNCPTASAFKTQLNSYLSTHPELNSDAVHQIRTLIEYDNTTIHEGSREVRMTVRTVSLLWSFLSQQAYAEADVGLWLDLYHQFKSLYRPAPTWVPDMVIKKWMKRWPSGLHPHVCAIRERNKQRIMDLLVRKIEHRHATSNRYIFPEGIGPEEKHNLVETWWNEVRFQLTFAVRSVQELNKVLGNTLFEELLHIYDDARCKGMPIFITPYYLSLLNTEEEGYDDRTLRSYIFYTRHLVDTYGQIKAWEKEDLVEEGKPNAAGWLVPDGHNIHRRYPEVAILIPDSMGRACGGLCASCQRLYDFQSKRLNFDFESLRPKESWPQRLKRLMRYFEHDTQLRDILLTGGDALMSQDATLRRILEAIYKMACRKREANKHRPFGEKYAEIQRIRIGTRLLIYLPMRIDEELIGILREFKMKGEQIGIKQFIIQTHFETPLELTPETYKAIKLLQSAGWTVTNQLVFNVAASRRGHTAKLREVLNKIGVICYYTFSVKGFEENHEVFAPNARSVQEAMEEKRLGALSREELSDLTLKLQTSPAPGKTLQAFCHDTQKPFIGTDRNVMNLPGIGKSMTFKTIGITESGCRILRFEHDATRKHSPIIHAMGPIYICENKSLLAYLRQLKHMGEQIGEYADLWNYREGQTEARFPFFEYPHNTDCGFTNRYSHLGIADTEAG